VTSIDIDPELVDSARVHLAEAGYAPTLAVADGAGGYPARAPYDRLIATCGFPAVEPAWLEQVVPGGLILVNLYTLIPAGALVALIVGNDRAAAGSFAGDWAGFMPTRAHHNPDALRLLETVDQDSLPAARPTAVTGGDLGRDGLRLLIALTVPASLITVRSQASGEETWLLSGDGSYARQTIGPDGAPMVVEGGKRSLWSAVEAVRRTWTELGEPGRDSLTLTVDPTGRHTLGCRGTAWSSTLPGPPA
jgi:hypothetical protein